MAELSPLMKQYFEIKNMHKEHILFYRIGDFYEMFYDDAVVASKELELTLTGKECGQEERAPMCGVPYHSYEAYVARLIKKGYKVAICEQTEDPALAKGLVKRDIIRVITPGTVVENSMLDESVNNYLCSVFVQGNSFGICFCDITTGELLCTGADGERDLDARLIEELGRYSPSEILFNDEFLDHGAVGAFLREKLNCLGGQMDAEEYKPASVEGTINGHFGCRSPEELGFKSRLCENAVGALLKYLYETQKNGVRRVSSVNFYTNHAYMTLDLTARRNLELTETIRGREKRGTLLWVLDKTDTAMGRRLLRSCLDRPLLDPVRIDKRLSAVEALIKAPMLLGDLSAELSGIYDLERMITRIVFGNANPREYKTLEGSIRRLPKLKNLLSGINTPLMGELWSEMDELQDLADLTAASIADEPPVTLKDGGVIREGYHAELDELRDLVEHTKSHIAAIETAERERTGIPKLKIGYNRVFGYYIEVSNGYKNMVPAEYIRRQTISNGERFVTQELKELEDKVLGAHDKILVLEARLFDEIRVKIAAEVKRVQRTADAIASLDVLCSFAKVSLANSYCRPEVDQSDVIDIKEGRHPVVEQVLRGTPFVPNGALLDNRENQIAVITGPNMAGKSTYMRQTALIVIMAQIGCFVPAKSAHIGIVSGVYTRVGASDDLAAGQSTFMVEMSEVAEILKNADAKSLLILDEIGRGTSTFDGMSIAHAVLEHIADRKKLGAKTLFATHYHELTDLENAYPNIRNYNVAVKKRGDDITFLRRIVPGGADDSYGIEVAKLAGIPNSVVKRAREILSALEEGKEVGILAHAQQSDDLSGQTNLFASVESEAERVLKKTDVETLTPIEALNLLYELKKTVTT
ncbi:MAG TPA: DNA mismatch repair protein MutS [Oscillospiraceae bacterium]|nr:DNA mismatch repair protein MutS [Oscillospiraceae bacterium]HNW04963.1 DNA mismatch repair protein MutS [Oscillospiraceae bacterium]